MSPVKTPDATRVLVAPEGWNPATDGSCEPLRIVDSGGVMYSYWKPSWKERVRIFFGGPVRLSVVGTTHPPVMLDTEI